MNPTYMTIQKYCNVKENQTLQHVTILISHCINVTISKGLCYYLDVYEKILLASSPVSMVSYQVVKICLLLGK